jgi:hypothetical protein
MYVWSHIAVKAIAIIAIRIICQIFWSICLVEGVSSIPVSSAFIFTVSGSVLFE